MWKGSKPEHIVYLSFGQHDFNLILQRQPLMQMIQLARPQNAVVKLGDGSVEKPPSQLTLVTCSFLYLCKRYLSSVGTVHWT